jgi:hypothetical protein
LDIAAHSTDLFVPLLCGCTLDSLEKLLHAGTFGQNHYHFPNIYIWCNHSFKNTGQQIYSRIYGDLPYGCFPVCLPHYARTHSSPSLDYPHIGFICIVICILEAFTCLSGLGSGAFGVFHFHP